MFNFFKKKAPKTNLAPDSEVKSSLTAQQMEQIEQKINQLLQQLEKNEDLLMLASSCEQIGLLYHQLNHIDLAIEYLEKSQQHKKSIGEGYKTLMNLYNAKRAYAAQHGSLADIDIWMNKMDAMRNIAKQMTIQRD